MAERLGRRDVLRVLSAIGFGALSGACAMPEPDPERRQVPIPDVVPPYDPESTPEGNLRALLDVLVPAERAEDGTLIRAGALEVEAFELLRLRTFLPAARALGFLPATVDPVLAGAEGFDAAIRAALDADLDALASIERPFTRFEHLPRALQVRAVRAGMDDPLRAPLLQFARAVAFIAYLGAVRSDMGLRAIGFPAFEDHAAGIAIRGYPRTREGRLVDAETEDLGALAAAGELDDYTFNLAPEPTDGDDLGAIVGPEGDLY
ncbi:MAG: hypothetical protein AB7S26_16100 [Sandaracinaceae bacterium]